MDWSVVTDVLAEETSDEPKRLQYGKKYSLLKAKYVTLSKSNEKLCNRIYHVQKEIRQLKKLKRFLIQRLTSFGDRFMDVCLEIPDNEPGASIEDRLFDDVFAKAAVKSTSKNPEKIKQKRSSVQSTRSRRTFDRTLSISTLSSMSSQLNSPAASINSSLAEFTPNAHSSVMASPSGLLQPTNTAGTSSSHSCSDDVVSAVVELISQSYTSRKNTSNSKLDGPACSAVASSAATSQCSISSSMSDNNLNEAI